MWLPLLGLLLGLAVGLLADIQIPAIYQNYLSSRYSAGERSSSFLKMVQKY